MAQGNSGSFYLAGTKNMGAMIYWSETYNAAANTHVVSIDDITFASSNWYQFTYYLQGSVTVDGSTVATFNSALGTHHVRVDSQYQEYSIEAAPGYSNPPYYTGTIYGNADGSKSVTISATIYGYSSDGRGANGFCVSGSQTVALYTVPRRSTISMTSTALGSGGTIYISRASSSFTHTVAYSFGNTSGTIATKTASTALGWTPPLTLANQIPNNTTGTCTLTCYTYNGDTLVGTSTTTVTLSVPDSVIPTTTGFSALHILGPVPASWGIYVQNKSSVQLNISGATGAYGSTISAYSITGGGYSGTSSSLTTGVLKTAGTITFTGKVKDSRGRWSAERTLSITVVAYSVPSFSSYRTQRCTSAGVISTNGTYAKGTVNFSYASCSGKNSVTTAVAYKKSSESTYTTTSVTFTSGTPFIFGGGNLSVDYSYDIRYTITDAFGSTVVVDQLSTASVLMDFKAGGTGISVGKVSENDDCFEVSENWDVRVYGMLLADYIRAQAGGGGGGITFGTCATDAATQLKVVTTDGGDFTPTKGATIAIKFTNDNSFNMPQLDIDGSGAKYIVSYNNYVPSTYVWKPGQTILFIYDGSYYVALYTSTATTGYYGITRLYSGVDLASTAYAATASAAKTAYDRNSWDSISLTNPLALAYGGTGATNAAAARSNLGLYATCLYSGAITTGSASFYFSGYKFFIIIGQLSSTGSRAAIVVPASLITTASTPYQLADESYYYSFNLYYSGSYGYLVYRGRNSTGQILYIYGVN